MSSPAALALSLVAGYGAFLLFTGVVLGWRGVGVAPRATPRIRRHRLDEWLAQADLSNVRVVDLAAVGSVLFVVGAGAAYALFAGVMAPVVAGVVAGCVPLTAARARRLERRTAAREAWPRMIEEIRLLTTSVGRSVPQALFDVGLRGPVQMRSAFQAAHREWLLSTDFERTLSVLKTRLADATADSVCETLLIAHEMGGSDLDGRLAALAEDRIHDLHGRKDAIAKQAGARFARAFVGIVPAGMAMVGLTIGDGRGAYATPSGQVAVVAAITMIAVCWLWAGRLMRLPEPQRVFFQAGVEAAPGRADARERSG